MIENAAADYSQLSGAIPAQRAAVDSRPAWSDDDTMVLPAFVTGRFDNPAQAAAEAVSEAIAATTPAAAVAAANHAREAAHAQAAATAPPATKHTVASDAGDRLPSSERNMLIFVAMLLALGTIAVVLTMGLGKFG